MWALVGLAFAAACSGTDETSGDRGPDGSPAVEVTLQGTYSYLADAALFTECGTGVSYPVAADGDAAALESAYLELQAGPGDPLLVGVRGYVALRQGADGGTAPTLVVKAFEKVFIGQGCEAGPGGSSLAGSEWTAVTLMGSDVQFEDPPTLLLDGEGRLVGWSGCSDFTGSYDLVGGRLRFVVVSPPQGPCTGSRGSREAAFLEVLERTRAYAIGGDTLRLRGESGSLGAFLESR